MTAREKTNALRTKIMHTSCPSGTCNPTIGPIGFDDAQALRRAGMALHRWYELECGDGRHHIERDSYNGRPYRVTQTCHNGICRTVRQPTPDREQGAIRRIAAICRENGLYYYLQTDPRGCALYVSHRPLDETNYDRDGVACDL